MSLTRVLCVLAAIVTLPAAAGEAPPAADWHLAGRLGQLQFIVVPEASARDRAYYDRIIETVCDDDTASCFLRFFTNASGVAMSFPLPDAVLAEPTVMYQRSAKHRTEQFQWSCRLGLAQSVCF
ncbi:hypothetical protein [Methyloversatilis sp.]|uniref:hypothetical protein n=1 Tax=Methyloversatilis sp. TaxID=2569862 RepID=UPI002733AE85|nr:hypothetical protein [Methyloversatilis sp.]MDP2869731.1 hypothetical protein [Methyloversatilis sp.]MDP3456258.1 hypothetical protein [Methyloversatilis sp.]MDP3579391.1 hypothetical protein [Methyloversatilis sp.]